MSEKYWTLNYADYPNRPEKLFCKHTPGRERSDENDETFIVHCEPGCECLRWAGRLGEGMDATNIQTEIKKTDWQYELEKPRFYERERLSKKEYDKKEKEKEKTKEVKEVKNANAKPKAERI